MLIRDATLEDAAALCSIYNHYITRTTITFEEQPLQTEAFAERIRGVRASYPWLVAEKGGVVLGYAYARAWQSRSAYRHTAESSVYLHPQAPRRQGTGEQLYRSLLLQLASRKIHRVIAAIAVPNESSIALHHKLGFDEAGYFHEVGYKFRRWIDVLYMELPLDSALRRNDNL
ncbi:N-acetyltransferase family protein [Thiolapillus sp.]